MRPRPQRRVCFVTGTRAESGLMESTLRAIQKCPSLELQIVATGVHTHQSRGNTVEEFRRGGWDVDYVVNWRDSSAQGVIARETGRVSSELVGAFEAMKTDIVLVVGDRVEAFAAASAAHLSGRVVAHVHGGDRAMGQADDSLRHAITKLAHLHFPATDQSARRLYRLGEDLKRMVVVGAPGIDGIRSGAASVSELKLVGLDYPAKGFTLLLLHPTEASNDAERDRTRSLIEVLSEKGQNRIVALMPNNDPGAKGISEGLIEGILHGHIELFTHVSRRLFLGLMRDCRLMVGNSSAGIIEAGSFATPVVNIGPRQQGRECGSNVFHAKWTTRSIGRAISLASSYRKTRKTDNPYDRGGAARRIAAVLASVPLDAQFRSKLIRY